jgi:hypothetical protein
MVFIAVGIWFKSSKERIHYQKYKKYAGNDKRSSGWSNLVLFIRSVQWLSYKATEENAEGLVA